MALDPKTFVRTKVTISLIDYGGSPVTTTIPTYIHGSLNVPTIWKKTKISAWVASSTGRSLYSVAVDGIAEGQTLSFQMLCVDVNDNTEVTATAALVRALLDDSVSGTAFSGYTFTSGLTGGSALQAKLAVTEVNEAGVSHVTTIPIVIDNIEDGDSNGFKAWTVSAMIVGAVTRA